jgi:hypothetical protein
MNMTLLQIVIAVALMAMIALLLVPTLLRPGTAALRPKRHKGFRRTFRKIYLMPIGFERLKAWMPGARLRPHVEFANIGEGTADRGFKSYFGDAAISRYNLVKQGSDDFHVAASAANTDIPLGVTTDSADSTALDVPVTVAVFGAAAGTLRVVLGGTVVAGDFLQSNGDGTAIKLKATTGSWYKIGRALTAGASGDTVEFAPCMPDLIVVP